MRDCDNRAPHRIQLHISVTLRNGLQMANRYFPNSHGKSYRAGITYYFEDNTLNVRDCFIRRHVLDGKEPGNDQNVETHKYYTKNIKI